MNQAAQIVDASKTSSLVPAAVDRREANWLAPRVIAALQAVGPTTQCGNGLEAYGTFCGTPETSVAADARKSSAVRTPTAVAHRASRHLSRLRRDLRYALREWFR